MRFHIRLWALLLLVGVVAAACGPEAPPRVSTAPAPPTDAVPLIGERAPSLLSGQIPDPRGRGDPAAPIVVIEYSDYQ